MCARLRHPSEQPDPRSQSFGRVLGSCQNGPHSSPRPGALSLSSGSARIKPFMPRATVSKLPLEVGAHSVHSAKPRLGGLQEGRGTLRCLFIFAKSPRMWHKELSKGARWESKTITSLFFGYGRVQDPAGVLTLGK